MSATPVYKTLIDVEAFAIRDFLTEAGIHCTLLDRHDTAYPGIVDRTSGQFQVLVPDEQAAQASQLVAEFLAAEPIMQPDLSPAMSIENTGDARLEGWVLASLIMLAFLAIVAFFAPESLSWWERFR